MMGSEKGVGPFFGYAAICAIPPNACFMSVDFVVCCRERSHTVKVGVCACLETQRFDFDLFAAS